MGVLDNDRDPDNSFVRYRSEPDHTDLERNLLYISMISVTIIFFLLFALYLYARFVLTRRSRHRATIRRLTLAALHVSDADRTRFFAEPPTAGLDPALIASLPTFTVRAKVLEGNSDGGGNVVECAVCLSALEGDEKAKLLPNCNHFFHVGCIDTWLDSHSTCPLCRAKVMPRLEPQDREGPVGHALDGGESSKSNGSIARLSSFRRILSRERSSIGIQPSSHGNDDHVDVDQDLERQ